MSTTLIIPCEPRVVANADAIIQSILDSHEEEQLKRHNLVIISPYLGEYKAEKFLDKLNPVFGNTYLHVLKTPCAEPFGFINAAFSDTLAYLDLNYSKDSISPVVWYDEKGQDRFQKDALDIIEAVYYKKSSFQLYGPENKTIAKKGTPGTMSAGTPEKKFPDHSFVFSSDFISRYPHTAPYVRSLSSNSHFRPFLAEALINDKSEKLNSWDSIFQVDANPAVPEEVTVSSVQVASTPSNTPVANFSRTNPPVVSGASPIPVNEPMTSTIPEGKADELRSFLLGKGQTTDTEKQESPEPKTSGTKKKATGDDNESSIQ